LRLPDGFANLACAAVDAYYGTWWLFAINLAMAISCGTMTQRAHSRRD
jgi:hypothetical protein